MEMAKNYMVDYLEMYVSASMEKMSQKERTVRVNIENGPAEEEIQKDKIQKDEIQKDEIQRDEVQETEAGTEETPAPVPDHSVVHMQRENRRRERTQNTAKIWQKHRQDLPVWTEVKARKRKNRKMHRRSLQRTR